MIEKPEGSPNKLTFEKNGPQEKPAPKKKRGRPEEGEDYPYKYYYRFYTASKNRRYPLDIERYEPGSKERAVAFAEMVKVHKTHYLMGQSRRKSDSGSQPKNCKK